MTQGRDPAPAPTRSLAIFVALGLLALAALAANVWGGLNFPYNAPVEQVICFGIVIDTVAVLCIAAIGAVMSRRPAPPASRRLAMTGVILCGVALAGVLVTAWIPSIVDLINGVSLHYSTETFATFILAPVWVTGLAISAFAHRRGGASRANLLGILGVAAGALVLAGAAASAVIYGLGLST